jgi:CDP-diacylglycerol--glycerol-3-phosphate 3-phosphatidyltransferase
MNIPNTLTLLRIMLVPALVAALLIRFENHAFYAVGVYLLAMATDWLDGFLARRWGQVTVFGVLLDPVADKMVTAAALISLVQTGDAPAWIVVILVGREFAVSGLRMIAASQHLVIPAHFFGKAKTFAEVPTLSVLILNRAFESPLMSRLGMAGLWTVLALSLLSGFDYWRKFRRRIDFAAVPTEAE